jgi:choline dehydrogenase
LSRKGRGIGLLGQILRYALTRTGLLTLVFGSVRAFTRSRADLPHPDIMLLAAPFIVDIKPGKSHRVLPVEGFYVNGHVQRTQSSGSIHVRSSDPFAAPAIRYRFLATEGDRRAAIAVIRRIREIMQSPPLRDFVAEEMHPGPAVQSDDQILEFLRTQGLVTHHMVGTCRMGQDAMAVVDERLRVHGIEGLRIADASVMPTIPSGNTAVPTMMIGEKCSDMVLADAEAADRQRMAVNA